jgi:hypothetical protein
MELEVLPLAENDKNSMQFLFGKWDNGEHTYGILGEALLKNKRGKIDSKTIQLLKECTICEIGNSTCNQFFEITFFGVCPGKPPKEKTVRICPLGCTSKTCILNK